jgi:hypothetical protein
MLNILTILALGFYNILEKKKWSTTTTGNDDGFYCNLNTPIYAWNIVYHDFFDEQN